METPLQVLLQQLKARELIVTGLVTERCVLFTAMDDYVRGYVLNVPADCVASGAPVQHQSAISYMRDVLGANVAPANKIR